VIHFRSGSGKVNNRLRRLILKVAHAESNSAPRTTFTVLGNCFSIPFWLGEYSLAEKAGGQARQPWPATGSVSCSRASCGFAGMHLFPFYRFATFRPGYCSTCQRIGAGLKSCQRLHPIHPTLHSRLCSCATARHSCAGCHPHVCRPQRHAHFIHRRTRGACQSHRLPPGPIGKPAPRSRRRQAQSSPAFSFRPL